jgi:hypothetical protein
MGCRRYRTQERLPNCDVSELVKQYPRGFLEPPREEMLARLAAVSALLRAELQGADIDAMLAEDPQLLMQDPASISKGDPSLFSFTLGRYGVMCHRAGQS